MSPSIELPEMPKYSTTALIKVPLINTFFASIFYLSQTPSRNSRVDMGCLPRRNTTSSLMVFPLFIILSSFAYCEVGKPSVYEVLQQYDFPIGILPLGVTDYELNAETGYFSAYLSGTCSFSVEGSYKLEYKSTITGVLSKGRLKDLKGVGVKVLFFWFSIVEVVRVGDDLQFSVGIASANFPVSNFEERPQCGCGFDCNQLRTVLPEYPVGTC